LKFLARHCACLVPVELSLRHHLPGPLPQYLGKSAADALLSVLGQHYDPWLSEGSLRVFRHK